MNKKALHITGVLLSLNIFLGVVVYSQENQKVVIVTNESGQPVSGARVIVGEGSEAVITDISGEFYIPLDSLVPVYVEAEGYDPQLISPSGSLDLKDIVLHQSPIQMGQGDLVEIPFGTSYKRKIPGATTVLSPREILKYDETDLEEILLGRVPGMFGTTNIRGMGTPLVVVDGIPRPVTGMNLQQVEQITVVKDLSSAMMYGSQASNGVILVTTRRGEPLRKSIRVTAENGFERPISYPQYLGAADYMELYNEALANDGLSAKFTDEQISNTRIGTDPVRYPDEDYYNSTYLKDWNSYQKVVGEASGGNEIAKYYLNLGWKRDNGLLKIGEGGEEKNDRLNMRGNIDYRLTKFVSLRFDGAVQYNFGNGPRYTVEEEDFWGLSTTLHPEYYPVLIPASMIKDPALIGAMKTVKGDYVLGGTSEYLTNIQGELLRNGYRQRNNRRLEMNTGLDFDLGSIISGLSASVFFSFDIFSEFTADLLNSYAVYSPVYADDSLYFSKYGVDLKVNEQTITNTSYYRRTGLYGKLNYSKSVGEHAVKATGVIYRDKYNEESVFQPANHLHFGLQANYSFKDKYVAELTGIIAGSTKLFETQPWSFSPGVGLSWIISEEEFLKGNRFIDYLKVHANWAIIHSDESLSAYYTGRNLYTEGSTYYYYQGIYSNSIMELTNGNPQLGWEKDMAVNIGFESMVLDSRLEVEAAYFYDRSYDLITQRSNLLPSYFTSLPFENFGSNMLQGAEAGIGYNLELGGVALRLGGNLVYSTSKVLEADELNYPEEYRSRLGRPTGAIFGYEALGLFRDPSDIDSSPEQVFGVVQPGDIKYKDLNGDRLINEADQGMIGNSDPRVGYGITFRLSFRSLELFMLGYGQVGQDAIFDNAYYWVYGDRKYSEEVLGRWTPATSSSATYPRLSATSNTNNFINSTYWLERNNWFKLQTVQLTYTLGGLRFAGMEEIRIFVRGNNLFKISKIREKTDLNIGTSPQTRAVSIGISVQF